MKKIALVLVLVMLAAASAALGESAAAPRAQEAGNAFDAYDKKGYAHGGVSVSGDEPGNVLSVCFTSADRTDCVRVSAVMTQEESAALDALDFFDDNYYEEEWAVITAFPADRVTVDSLNDLIPPAETVNAYKGKTVADLVRDGYEWYSDAEDENGEDVMVFYSFETMIEYAVTLEGDLTDPEALSDERIGSQVIGSIRFWGIDE